MKAFNIIAILLFVSVIGFIAYRITSSQEEIYRTALPQKRDISEVIHISGNVYPLKEIEVKSQLSGILEELYVKIGDKVTLQTPIASIRLVPNISEIERLESSVNSAQIEYDARLVEYSRAKRLYESNTISASEMEAVDKNFMQIKEQLSSAKNQLDIVKKGEIRSKNISNLVVSSTTGTIIDIPIETGSSVIERNNYNPGTTLAIIAQMDRFKFTAYIAEHHLQHIEMGDTISLTFNAYDNISTDAVVTQISAKGSSVNGIMKYLLNAEFDITDNMPTLRSGYSASAEIVIARKNNRLSIEEKYIKYSKDSIYVNVLDTLTGKALLRVIESGISDGTFTEIISGISDNEQVIID